MTALLEKDYTVYLEHLDEFLQHHRGDFVLIKNRKVVDFFPSYEKALKYGLKRFGNVPFFIKVVQQEEEIHFFHQGIRS